MTAEIIQFPSIERAAAVARAREDRRCARDVSITSPSNAPILVVNGRQASPAAPPDIGPAGNDQEIPENLKEEQEKVPMSRTWDYLTRERNPVAYLKGLKEILVEDDYEYILCGVMDVEYYEKLDPDGKGIVDHYFHLCNPKSFA